MEIRWLGHSCFKLQESTGTSCVTDPFDEEDIGYAMQPVEADVVTLSHIYDNDNHMNQIIKVDKIINSADNVEIDGIRVVGFSSKSYIEDIERENIIYKFRMDGVDICHLGNLGEANNFDIVDSIGTVNVLIIPIGGHGVLNAEEAKEYVDMIMPDVVIPMQYKTKDCNRDLDKLDDFLNLFDDKQIVYLKNDIKDFDRMDFDGDETKVFIYELEK